MIVLGDKNGLSIIDAQDLSPANIINLTTTQLTNLSQTQQVFVTINLTKAVMAFELISEIPDFVGSGFQNKVSQETTRTTVSISARASVVVI